MMVAGEIKFTDTDGTRKRELVINANDNFARTWDPVKKQGWVRHFSDEQNAVVTFW